MIVTALRVGHYRIERHSHAKQYTGVTAYSVHPGIVRSNLQGHDPTVLGSVVRTVMKVAARSTPLEGALNSLFCATSPRAPIMGQGQYFVPVGKLDSRAANWLNDSKTNKKLWQQSEDLINRLM